MGQSIFTRITISRAGRVPVSVMALASACVVVTAWQLVSPAHLENEGLRAAVETTITIFALTSTGLMFVRFRQTQRVCDLMLLGALLTVSLVDLPSSALPALVGAPATDPGMGQRLVSQVLIAIAFLAAVWAPTARPIDRFGRLVALAGLTAVSVTDVIGLMTSDVGSRENVQTSVLSTAASHPIAFLIQVGGGVALLLSGVAFLRQGENGERERTLLGLAALLLAGARLQLLAMPAHAADWVTPASVTRMLAYGVILLAAIRQHQGSRHEATEAALIAERERIARDLHDGIAQDLAVIAMHGDRMAAEQGPHHPLAIAARRALAASRGTIIDLAASGAPTTAAALRLVAQEMEARYGVTVDVKIDKDRATELRRGHREEVVRIAREAIVNAVKHGGARRISVELGADHSEVLLRVSDDGCGVDKAIYSNGCGLGLPTMRTRADTVGGRLIVRRRSSGGTEVNVMV
jgi:signal transduction histidine kinase